MRWRLQEDNELFNGDGGSTYGGIEGLLAAVGTAGVYTCDANENLWTEIDIEDMIATVGKLPDRYFPFEPSWLCSACVFQSSHGSAGFRGWRCDGKRSDERHAERAFVPGLQSLPYQQNADGAGRSRRSARCSAPSTKP